VEGKPKSKDSTFNLEKRNYGGTALVMKTFTNFRVGKRGKRKGEKSLKKKPISNKVLDCKKTDVLIVQFLLGVSLSLLA